TPYPQRFDHILTNLANVDETRRGARFVCIMALAIPGGDIHIIRGEIVGQIAHKPAGDNGFGYDPIFYVPKFGKTMAELTNEEKNSISHRGVALQAMRDLLIGINS
ncbi:MAG: non-canonical purine NTP pyrophosphatase, partial [Defluviitaleaceae bacterium]|nr:non-canonical purine NTP pyrophosphatase [Defluviitaleaceae bacterium]